MKIINYFIFLFVLMLSQQYTIMAQTFPYKGKWVDSVYNTLTPEERVGQLFMVAAYSGGDKANAEKIEQLVAQHKIGGIIFMQGTAEAQAKLTNTLQQKGKVKLLIGMDAEWGLGMRLTGVRNFPRQMMLGATRDTGIVYHMATAIAKQCKRLGVHIDFAPVIDINNNPKNPVINFRSFGEDKEWVSKLGIAYMNGLQDNGIMACAKHFPGHGDVAVDSHLDLPIVKKDKAALTDMEFYPFKTLINAGVKSIMIAHLSMPALDARANRPSTVSYPIVTDILKKEMGFGGLIFTDALDMKGITKHFGLGEIDLAAFEAGNDVLLFSQDVVLGTNKIMWALKTGAITEQRLEHSVKKILGAKYEAGLYKYQPLKEQKVTEDLNAVVDSIKAEAAEKAITLVRDRNKLLAQLEQNTNITYVNINSNTNPELFNLLAKKYNRIQKIDILSAKEGQVNKAALNNLPKEGIVIVGIHNLSLYPGKTGAYGLQEKQITALQQLAKQKNVIFAIMGNAYSIKPICNAGSILVGYEDDLYTQKAMFNVLTAQKKPLGRLPVSVCK
jgi:beta-N-acetylhexosaminidase